MGKLENGLVALNANEVSNLAKYTLTHKTLIIAIEKTTKSLKIS